jgi:hypothetical protein
VTRFWLLTGCNWALLITAWTVDLPGSTALALKLLAVVVGCWGLVRFIRLGLLFKDQPRDASPRRSQR